MRANSVVVVPEAVELGLKVVDRGRWGLVSEPFLQGLLEPLDFPLGLGGGLGGRSSGRCRAG